MVAIAQSHPMPHKLLVSWQPAIGALQTIDNFSTFFIDDSGKCCGSSYLCNYIYKLMSCIYIKTYPQGNQSFVNNRKLQEKMTNSIPS